MASWRRTLSAKPNGEEELSAHGKTLLANALAQYGDSVAGRPIVIEGIRMPTAPRINSRSHVAAQPLPANISSITFGSTPPTWAQYPS